MKIENKLEKKVLDILLFLIYEKAYTWVTDTFLECASQASLIHGEV